jgi:hypothetical protein
MGLASTPPWHPRASRCPRTLLSYCLYPSPQLPFILFFFYCSHNFLGQSSQERQPAPRARRSVCRPASRHPAPGPRTRGGRSSVTRILFLVLPLCPAACPRCVSRAHSPGTSRTWHTLRRARASLFMDFVVVRLPRGGKHLLHAGRSSLASPCCLYPNPANCPTFPWRPARYVPNPLLAASWSREATLLSFGPDPRSGSGLRSSPQCARSAVGSQGGCGRGVCPP